MNGSRAAMALAAVLVLVGPAGSPRVGWAEDAQAKLPLAAPGSKFHFEVIESHDAEYLCDTPGHMGRDGGLTVRPNVALGEWGGVKTSPRTAARRRHARAARFCSWAPPGPLAMTRHRAKPQRPLPYGRNGSGGPLR